MEENKNVKEISLGTVICICIIIALIATLVGTIAYYNRKNKDLLEIIELQKENISGGVQEDKIDNEEKEPQNENIIEEVQEDKINVGEIYISSFKEYQQITLEFEKIGFSSDNKFVIEDAMFNITGNCELIEENIKRCKIEKYSYNEPDGRKTHSLIDNGWYIDFKIINGKKLEVVSNTVDGESEIAICLSGEFGIESEFTRYDIKDFIGTWTTKNVYKLDNSDYYPYYKEANLVDVLGAVYSQTGSIFTLKENGSFKDLVYPITEGDMHRDGAYTFDKVNKVNLKYNDDSSKMVEIYMLDKNTIAYNDNWNYVIILEKLNNN